MKSKGQIALEYIFIMTIALAFLTSVVNVAVFKAVDHAEDVKRVGQIKFAAEKLSEAVDYIGSQRGAAKTRVHVYIPKLRQAETDLEYEQRKEIFRIECNEGQDKLFFYGKLNDDAGNYDTITASSESEGSFQYTEFQGEVKPSYELDCDTDTFTFENSEYEVGKQVGSDEVYIKAI